MCAREQGCGKDFCRMFRMSLASADADVKMDTWLSQQQRCLDQTNSIFAQVYACFSCLSFASQFLYIKMT